MEERLYEVYMAVRKVLTKRVLAEILVKLNFHAGYFHEGKFGREFPAKVTLRICTGQNSGWIRSVVHPGRFRLRNFHSGVCVMYNVYGHTYFQYFNEI